MRILIVTQKVHVDAPILGFFLRWLEHLSPLAEQCIVVSQQTGNYSLPDNIHVHSMGKESGRSRIRQVLTTWKILWKKRREYDVALVHMTPVWVLLNALPWMVLRKPVFLWYESKGRRWTFYASLVFVKKVFSATDLGLGVFKKKNVVTNHGVDTSFWKASEERDERLIVTMGRVSAVKRMELIIKCFATLPPTYRLLIIGGPFIGTDIPYYKDIEKLICDLKLYDRIIMHFMDSANAREHIAKARLYLHASTGTLDKSLLQAMACETPVISCCATNPILPPSCLTSPDKFAATVGEFLEGGHADAQLGVELRKIVERDHSLSKLLTRLCEEMKRYA